MKFWITLIVFSVIVIAACTLFTVGLYQHNSLMQICAWLLLCIDLCVTAYIITDKPLPIQPIVIEKIDDVPLHIMKFTKGVRYYLNELENGDQVWHVIGHINSLCVELDLANKTSRHVAEDELKLPGDAT